MKMKMLIRVCKISLLCFASLALAACSLLNDTQAERGPKAELSKKRQRVKAKREAEQRESKATDEGSDGGEVAAVAGSGYEQPVQAGTLEEVGVAESSGIAASRLNAGLFWTHNDSGDPPLLYAFDGRGARRGVWRVAGAKARDWEDIAAAPGTEARRSYLYIGDIGDNDKRRAEIVVYRVAEPTIAPDDIASTKSKPLMTEPAEAFRLRYPDGSHDAEALLVHPTSGDIYIVTKTTTDTAIVYKATAPLDASETTTMTRVGEVNVQDVLGGMMTGGDIAPDGRRVVLCDYFNGYELRLDTAQKPFDAIWQQTPVRVALGERVQGEAVAYSLDGKSLFATSEKRPAPLFEIRQSGSSVKD
jgi:hypothetical protein